jgi:hypothetical protein
MRKPSFLENRKGVFYLLLTAIFISVMVIVFLSYHEYSFTNKQKVVETRIMALNDFIKSIESDSKNVIRITGYRALIAIEDYVATSVQYFANDSDMQEHFRKAFYYGNFTTNCTLNPPNPLTDPNCIANGALNYTQMDILNDSAYINYLQKLKEIAAKLGIDIDINVTDINFNQSSPWSVEVVVTTNIIISDQRNLSSWNFMRNYTTEVSIIDIRDPVYSVYTFGRAPNPIRKWPGVWNDTLHFVIGNDITNLMNFTNSSYYVNNTLAPSFLMRLEGRLNESSACCGIESFVNIPKLSDQSIPYNSSRSIVDYIYLSDKPINHSNYQNITCYIQNITSTHSWFKIDMNHTLYHSPNYIDYIGDLNRTFC